MSIEIPTIYEENIIEVVHQSGNVIFKYYVEEKIYKIAFHNVYFFDFTEFDYVTECDWKFGLNIQTNSTYIEKLVKEISKDKLQRAFGGEYSKLSHYKLVIDDVGMYNVVCKDIELAYI